MIKKPNTYLFYGIIALVLFVMAVFKLHSENFNNLSYIDLAFFILPLIIGITLIIRYFIETKRGR
jgi:hypothetical protein